jgi:hypothetical protein
MYYSAYYIKNWPITQKIAPKIALKHNAVLAIIVTCEITIYRSLKHYSLLYIMNTLYLKIKCSNHSVKFIPREHAICKSYIPLTRYNNNMIIYNTNYFNYILQIINHTQNCILSSYSSIYI